MKRINQLLTDRHLNILIATWAGLIMILALTPRFGVENHSNPIGINHGFLAHFGAYSLLAAMLYEYLTRKTSSLPVLKSFFIAGCYGAMIECAQYLLPYRAGDLQDVAMNFTAACCGAIAMRFYGNFFATRDLNP